MSEVYGHHIMTLRYRSRALYWKELYGTSVERSITRYTQQSEHFCVEVYCDFRQRVCIDYFSSTRTTSTSMKITNALLFFSFFFFRKKKNNMNSHKR